MAVKLDMSKAYYRVEWNFVEGVIKKMGFDPGWVDLLMKSVYSIIFCHFKWKYKRNFSSI